jgi:hypothetical protein
LQREVFAAAAASDNPVEVWYDGLNCQLEYVEQPDREFGTLSD